jgi:hypothetical protein
MAVGDVYAMVRAHIAALRGVPSEAPPRPPTVRQVTGWLTRHPSTLTYEYQRLSEAVYFGRIGERGSVAIATSGLFGRIAVDLASGHVVRIPGIESATASHVNRDLDSFRRCVAAVIQRFPFYAEGDEERLEEVAEELRDLVSGIDETALAHNGFWETFCDDVAIGDYADWEA